MGISCYKQEYYITSLSAFLPRSGAFLPRFNLELELPPSMFYGCTLVKLMLYMKAVIDFPVASPACFPKLKVLVLCLIRFNDDNNSATNLISSCPVLEDLDITTFNPKCFSTLNVSATCLERFNLQYYFDTGNEPTPSKYVPKLLLHTPALKYISILDFEPYKYEVKNCSSLVKAEIHISNIVSATLGNFVTPCALELLNRIANVKSLSIAHWTILDDDLPSLPMFPNLTSLEFRSVGFTESWYWKVVIAILERCPLLEVLIIEDFAFSDDGLYGDWNTDVPSCLISHLKIIELTRSPESYAMIYILYFLKNGNVLEKMILKGFAEKSAKILNLRRASPTCQIEFQE